MATFERRTEAPTTDNQYYYASNPFYKAGYGLPNCTAYAWGRFWELTGGSAPRLSTRDAEIWYQNTADGYQRGNTPKLGAVICWAKGDPSTDNDGAGHVAIVEAINADGSIVTSESGWGASSLWWEKTRTNDNGRWGQSSAYTFQGFIYNPVDFDNQGGGSVITGNRYLTQAEMETNARYIWNYLSARGWSKNAVAGLLGNMQTESTINPGIWEGLNEGTGPGFGLVQWTPYNKYTDWCADQGIDPAAMDSALRRIEYELSAGIQYYSTDAYPLSFAQFKVSTQTPEYLAMTFLHNYERPADSNQPNRATQARAWYNFLGGTPTPSTPSSSYQGGQKKMPFILLASVIRRRS